MIAFFTFFLAWFFVPSHTVYLPVIQKPLTPCGVEVWPGGDYAFLDALNCPLVRYNPGTSMHVGAYTWWVQNGRTWQSLAYIQADLVRIRQHGGEPVLVLYGNSRGGCAPVEAEGYQDYAFFVAHVVERFMVRYVEIWNEADYLIGHPNLYGCWGDATSFREFFTTIKNALPAEVAAGTSVGYTSGNALAFVRGLPADFIGFHYYGGDLGELENKITTLQTLTSVPLWLTETNFLSHEPLECRAPSEAFEANQARYFEEVLELTARTKVVPFFYALTTYADSWRCAALLRTPMLPSQGYEVLRTR